MNVLPPRTRLRSLSSLTLAVAGTVVAAGVGTAVAPVPGLHSVALGQFSPATAPTPQPPFAGVVTLDRVEVRSGAGESYYPVAELRAGDRVRVVEDFYGWYRIEAPEGLRAFVMAKDVNRRGDGTIGIANAESTRVTIKGLNRGWNESFRTIKTLAPGERVTIIATAGDEAYEILAPEGSLVFLPPGSVEAQASLVPADAPGVPVTPAPAITGGDSAGSGEMVPLAEAMASEESGFADAPATGTGTGTELGTDEAATADPGTPGTLAGVTAPDTLPPLNLADDAADQSTAAADLPALRPAAEAEAPSEGLAAVEQAQLARFALPLEEQPLDEMEASYQALLDGGELRPFEVRLVESRMQAVRRNRQLLAAIEQIQQRKDGLVVVEPTPIEPEPEAPYAAVGVLRTSSVFAGEEGGVALPKMYRVVDPATERTIAYLRPARGLDPVPLLGRLVGVRGNKEIDPTLGTPLVTAQRVVALDPSEE